MKNARFGLLAVAFGFCVLTTAPHAEAETPVGPEVFGLGLALGDPTAITAKIMPADVFGIQLYVGAGNWWWWHRSFMTGIDVVFHPTMIYEWRTVALNWTIGAGAGVAVFHGDPRYNHNDYYWEDRAYGGLIIRMVTGVNLWFKKIPLECFVELNPGISMINPYPISFRFYWTFAGARWYF